MKTIIHVTTIAAPRVQVYEALSTVGGLASWWTTSVAGEAASEGNSIAFTFGGDFNPEMLVTAAAAPERIAWKCVAGVEQWAENTFHFDLEERGTGTLVRFRQDYANELSDEDYGIYNYNWGYYLDSLRLYCETGTGKPYRPGRVSASLPGLVSIARATARPGEADRLESELVGRVAATRAQPGCIGFQLYRQQGEPTVIAVELWESREAWEHHQHGEHVTSLADVFAAVLDEPPELRLCTPVPELKR